ncbi:hypothetical protein N7983_20455 [Priestia megaterium]|uniref:hypothetical protein n=1 Tax=Priestia megaterium TaxID=1404 RepID=UPI0021D66453|nr:hypothetical protein [Priestia megaterium]MCU7745543.1 hypothetical protein [Priestia megaterium]
MSNYTILNFTWNNILSTLSFIITVIVFFERNNIRPGLEGLFLLPVAFGLCIQLFNGQYLYSNGGLGLKIFFLIMLVRYNIVPLLIGLTKGSYNTLPITMPMLSVSSNGYIFSIIMSLVETFVCFAAISYYTKKAERKKIIQEYHNAKQNLSLSVFGLIGLLFFIAILFSRNLSQVFSTFTFFTIDEKYENPNIDAFGILAIQVIKMFIFLILIIYSYKKYNQNKNPIWVILAVVIGFLNMSIFFGYNRSFVLQTAIATIYVLYSFFPSYRKILVGLLIPVCSLIMLSMIFIKQFGVSYTETTHNPLDLAQLANTIEAYVGGPWSLASGYDAYNAYGGFSPLPTFLKDFILNCFLSYMPGLEFLLEWFPNTESSPVIHQIYTNSFQMLPLSATCLFYGGILFGPIISLLFYIVIMRLLVKFDYKSKLSKDISRKYLYTLIAVLLSFTMCYTWVTLLWSFTKNILFLSLLITVNEIHLLRYGKIKRVRTF